MKEAILYEDESVLLVHKPGGTAVQTRRPGQKDMVSIFKNYRVQKGEEPYLAVVHRLDQPVEGALLFAKTKDAAAGLSRQFLERAADKHYRAAVWNQNRRPLFAGDRGELLDYLLKDGKNNLSCVVKKGTAGAKRAVLSYEVKKTYKDMAEISIKLETGRHHQIRVQMANAGYPLIGDLKYGRKDPEKESEFFGFGNGIALCSVKLSFFHPKTGKKMEFETKPKNPVFQLLHTHPDIV